MTIDYRERIPNNVGLAEDKSLQRALEHWQPRFLDWWREMGPSDFLGADVYLRTATSADAKGWASYGQVRLPEYRWGIFLAAPTPDRRIGFGDDYGEPAWQQVPGEHRATLRRLIVTQGDTEPASVEQQRLLGFCAPSLYDLRNLFQINVEEARHLWAMVYLLHAHFGRDGREEAEALLERHSGNLDRPRILGTFNERIDDWLSFLMFTYFTDRDGKYQLKSLAESAFDPLSRTCTFMLTEEAHHMYVGDSGISRVIRRTLEAMRELKTDDPARLRAAGVIDLPTLQRYMNYWFSSSLDLFGAEVSSNAAHYFAAGIKGRPDEARFPDHREVQSVMALELPNGKGEIVLDEAPLRNAMNEVARLGYIADCEVGIGRWNKLVERAGSDFRFRLPSPRFRRSIGAWAGVPADPEGHILSHEACAAGSREWLPTADDRRFVQSLMQRVVEPGKIAGWIAPPNHGVNNLSLDYEYVRLN